MKQKPIFTGMFAKWFNRKEKYYGDFAFLGIDMHSHLLPAIDDGSQSPEDSLRFIEALQALGWKGAVTTPHIISDLYPNTKQTISDAFEKIKVSLPENFSFAFAAEYMVDEFFEQRIATADLLTFADDYVLIEMSYLAESPRIRESIFDLRIKNYKPVLAHPERYNFYHRRYDRLIELKDMGCLFQLNLLSITGYYGAAVKQTALKLLADHMYDLAGTDLHHERHLKALIEMQNNKVMQQLSAYSFSNSKLFHQ